MLDAGQIAAFRRDGFLVVPDVVPGPVLAALRAEYDGLVRAMAEGLGIAWRGDALGTLAAINASGHPWFQPLDITLPGDRIEADTPFHYGPAVHDLLTCDALVDLAEQVLGSAAITSTPIQHTRIKPPERGGAHGPRALVTATSWHQDRGVAHAEADQTDMLTVWVAVTDATEDNGCLMALPKTPDQAMLPHCPLEQTAIPTACIDETRARALPVGAGGVVLIDPMTPHCAGPNRSDGFRWSFDLRYQRSGQPTGRAHFPCFPVRGAPVPDWRSVRDAWLAARAVCAGAPHIPIHRWTEGSPHCA